MTISSERPELPKDWAWASLRELLEVNYGKALPETKRREGSAPVFGSNGPVGFHDTALTRGVTLVIGRKGSAGAVHLSKAACWPIDTTYFVDCFPAGLSPAYMLQFLRSQDLASLDRSTAIPGLNRDDLYQTNVPLPPSAEQGRIVTKIDELFTQLDAGVEALHKVQAQLRRYRQAVLRAAFEGKLTEEWRLEHRHELIPAGLLLDSVLENRRAATSRPQVELPFGDGSGLPALPSTWLWTRVGALFDVTIGGTPSRRIAEYWGGGIPWVSSGEVAFRRIRATQESITEAGLQNSNAKLHPPGTVLLAMIGEGKTRGQSAILDVAAATNQNMASILCAATPIPPEWVFYWFVSRYSQIRGDGSGGVQPALNCARVRDLVIPLAPLQEQLEIISRVNEHLSLADKLEEMVDRALSRSERLRQAILKRAFEGKLVSQDPADEPAEVLVERIRAVRSTKVTKRRGSLALRARPGGREESLRGQGRRRG